MLTEALEFVKPSREVRELAILTEIGKNPSCSQRSLARVARVSPTMVNAYVDALVGRGEVQVTGETNRSYTYTLTGPGRSRRDDLRVRVSREVIRLYARLKRDLRGRMEKFHEEGVKRAVLFGAGDTSELVVLASGGTGVEIVGVVDSDPARRGRRIGDVEVTGPETEGEIAPDAVIITSHTHAEEMHDAVRHLEVRGIQVIRL